MRYFAQLTRQRSTILALVAVVLAIFILAALAWTKLSATASAANTPQADGAEADQAPTDTVQDNLFGEADTEQAPKESETEPQSTAVSVTPIPEIVVYITGAIREPDDYTLPATARVKDLVVSAGGLTEEADTEQINLAAHVKDADHIHIPRRGENAPSGSSVATTNDGTASASNQDDALVNINTASAAELDALQGIGEVLAQRIIDYRTENGSFTAIEDIKKVKGITSKVYADIAPHIAVTS